MYTRWLMQLNINTKQVFLSVGKGVFSLNYTANIKIWIWKSQHSIVGDWKGMKVSEWETTLCALMNLRQSAGLQARSELPDCWLPINCSSRVVFTGYMYPQSSVLLCIILLSLVNGLFAILEIQLSAPPTPVSKRVGCYYRQRRTCLFLANDRA